MRDTQLLRVDPVLPFSGSIEIAAQLLREGKLVVFPTETVYGLGANALSEAAVRGIFEAKGRPSNNPLIVHVTDATEAVKLTTDWPETAVRLAESFWPGPLTLVLPRSREIPDVVTGGGPTVAVRCPAHPVARALLKACRLPVAAPSANRSGRLSPTRAEHVLNDLNGRVDLILDGGPTPEGIESTVVDLSGERPRLLRPGTLSPDAIERVVGPLAMIEPFPEDGALRSPGMLSSHYAPRTPLILFEKLSELNGRTDESIGVVALVSSDAVGFHDWSVWVEMPADPRLYAARIYDELHNLDGMGLSTLWVQMPPEGGDWLGVRDRLRRGAV